MFKRYFNLVVAMFCATTAILSLIAGRGVGWFMVNCILAACNLYFYLQFRKGK